jgi:thymidylate synthase (FAD)
MKILNHGSLVLVDSMGNDMSIVRSARVSYDAEARTGEDAGKDAKLINYLMKNKHTTPFEAVTLTFEIKCPIFVTRQVHRHRTFSYNEISARYSVLPAEFYVPEVSQITSQSKANKQQRTDEVLPNAEALQHAILSSCHDAHNLYNRLIREGCPRELARGVLPVNTYTKFFMTGNLLNFFKFIALRSHPHAQYEVAVYSDAMLVMIEEIAPIATAAFKEHWLGEQV